MNAFSPMLAAANNGSNAALVTFLLYTLAVFGLAWASNKLLQSRSFLSEYFLGSRGLGVWAFALTFAATSASGGSFTGFPAKIYSHGWILALWIASYMVVPICAMGLLGKRINQVARISGSITVPDVLRDRFHSASFGLLATLLIVFFMTFNLVAQFKAGSEILKTLLLDVEAFKDASAWMAGVKTSTGIGFLSAVDPGYLLCLLVFAVAVIAYTTYGGFHAVVWTDVMQGVVMVVGVMIMLPLAIYLVGGLGHATEAMSYMVPPEFGRARVEVTGDEQSIPAGIWLSSSREEEAARLRERIAELGDDKDDEKLRQLLTARLEHVENGPSQRLYRLSKTRAVPKGESGLDDVRVLEVRTPFEVGQHLFRLQLEGLAEDAPERAEIEKQMKEIVSSREVPEELPSAPQNANFNVSDFTPGKFEDDGFKPSAYAYGKDKPGVYVSGPGPHPTKEMDGFLPFSIAISFFFMWAISGAGQPSSMVRLMAFNSARTLRRSIFTVAMYYSMIYFPLVLIFCCSRLLLPGMETEPDRIMPQMAVHLTSSIGMGWLAGLLIAAPFAAVMSTVDSFLLMISSALVRDVYQRNINPEVEEKTIKRMSYLFTLVVGTGAMFGAVNPPQFLQDIIVYTGSGLAACFLGPMVFTLYWPRTNVMGAIAGMVGGFAAHISMYITGMFTNDSFYQPETLFGFNPVVVGLVVSFVSVYVVSLLTPPPPEELVNRYFRVNKP